ncbi:hypothetical protein HQ346_01510 [Rhodococcus sp. BP-252]|uniref:Uncharacterized protein n=1 Tax=Rhodococcoides kyotonense TaxID=398843 RepID=A0A177YFE3_9NOCA|nr:MULTISPECIES: hypothetical protein [unclassified Rhodococcus (in: high G+C Gram-positive bacteria)]MBY6454208.1 hypothetical protein [Rhodococcus sp. BP-277]MBY6487951.1 hypothetical protein [Rhodococcus sp. BP-291]MBY6492914.1 hypothetical protein [Rhodococcus sp. BP-314]OAK54276.1 hypothetical protein A3K89_02370 [Rhodococcus kyotonensis]MBY6414955.1 hypothetical protein [Rhodococcus sp. BP-321]
MAQCSSDARSWRDGTAYRVHGRRSLGGRAQMSAGTDATDSSLATPPAGDLSRDGDGVEPA